MQGDLSCAAGTCRERWARANAQAHHSRRQSDVLACPDRNGNQIGEQLNGHCCTGKMDPKAAHILPSTLLLVRRTYANRGSQSCELVGV